MPYVDGVKLMNKQQMEQGRQYLIEWLSDKQELGKAPAKIEYTFEFDRNDLHYYVYRFKKGLMGKWMIGICGFDGDDMENIGHVFSGMDEYEENGAPELAQHMAQFLYEYWRKQAGGVDIQEVFKQNLKYISQTEVDAEKIARQFVKTETRFFLTVGTVDVPSGKVTVADPLCYLSGEHVIAPVLEREIPKGSYPVEVSICRHDDIGIRMCTARLKIKDTKAVRYELAKSTEDTAAFKAKDGIMHGYPVDAGMMCFIDADAAKNYDKFITKWHTENPGKNHYDDYFQAFFEESDKKLPAYQREGGDFIEWANPDTGERMVQISSGFGDGFYQSFWGFDESGEVCELIAPLVDPDLYDS